MSDYYTLAEISWQTSSAGEAPQCPRFALLACGGPAQSQAAPDRERICATLYYRLSPQAAGMLAEKAYHLGGSVGALRIGIGASGTPPTPRMPRLVDNPPLHHGPAASVMVDHAGVGMAACHLSAFRRRVVRGPAGAV